MALAVSLHAPNDELRDNLVPLNRKYPLAELLDACNRYLAHAPRDFITFEYCMLDGVNDQPEHARQLVELVRHHARQRRVVQAQPDSLQPVPASGLMRSPHTQVLAFAKILSDAGIVTTVRKTRGDDIDAACGQLAGDVKDRTRVGERIAQQRTVMLKQVPAWRPARRRHEIMTTTAAGVPGCQETPGLGGLAAALLLALAGCASHAGRRRRRRRATS